MGKQSVLRWSKQLEAQHHRQKLATKINMEILKREIEQYPDAYQYERAERCESEENRKRLEAFRNQPKKQRSHLPKRILKNGNIF